MSHEGFFKKALPPSGMGRRRALRIQSPYTGQSIAKGRAKVKRGVVLLSGGLDSATTLAVARRDEFAVYALSVDYGQRHWHELACARRVAASLGVERHAQ